MRHALFVDRDGTLIFDKEYLHRPEEVEFFPGAISALKAAQHAGFDLVMVTNQSGVGRGYFTMADVERVHSYIDGVLAKSGVSFLKTYTAPEAPDVPSRGRKPSPQFLFDARDEFGINLARSYIVGDKLSDVQCGWNAGVRKSILVRTGEGHKVEAAEHAKLREAVIVDDLSAAVDWLLKHSAA
jgi:D-glycero-D-manno-heptose 1,7-bisphosphate phosphatase